LSTLLLLVSLIFSTKLIPDYLHDKIKSLRIRLSLILIAGLLFVILQSLAWLEILNMHVAPEMETIQNYLYLFSGLHLTHIIAGVILTAYLFYRVASVEGDPVKSLILLTNPFEKTLLEILTVFWHYTIALWVVIYLMLLLVY
jgi:cytochrome c oxidase subunit 3